MSAVNSPPIRVALVGLSASAKTSWASSAHLPYLTSARGSSRYNIVALLNSSLKAAETARSEYKLPASVKCYGDPEAMANDPNIDLVVINTRVDVHYPTVTPSLKAGRAVFVEWPLVENLQKAIELTGDKTIPNSIVGLQGRVMPITLRIKNILSSGVIGKVLSSTVQAFNNIVPRDALPEGVGYFADRKIGGNNINIAFAHLIDHVHEVLGEWKDFDSRMQIQRPVLRLLDAQGNKTGEVKTNVPDLLSWHGKLQGQTGSKGVVEVVPGATLAAICRVGPGFPGQAGLTWTILGEKGELMLTAPGPFLFSGYSHYSGPSEIRVHDFETDQVTEMEWDWPGWQKEFEYKTRNTAELYERYAEWVGNGKPDKVAEGRDFPRLHDAVVRMKEFDKLFKQFDPEW